MLHAAIQVVDQERVVVLQARPDLKKMGSIAEPKSSALTEQRSTCVQETWPLAATHKPPSAK